VGGGGHASLAVGDLLMQLLLSTDETVILRDLLSSYLPELRREVARTEQHELRHLLVLRLNLAERLLDQLAKPAA
jgi:hypothetical protein